MEKRLRKAIWTAKLGIGLYVTFLFVHVPIDHYREIYPSLVFPGFANAPVIRDSVSLSFVDFYAVTPDKKRVDIPKRAFFDSLFPKHAPFLLNNMIKKETLKEKNGEYLARRLEFGSYSRKMLKKTFPDMSFDSLYISKYQRSVNVNNGIVSDVKKQQSKIGIAL